MRDVSAFLCGMIWTFFISWKLSLAVTTLIPVIAALTAMNVQVSSCQSVNRAWDYFRVNEPLWLIISALHPRKLNKFRRKE